MIVRKCSSLMQYILKHCILRKYLIKKNVSLKKMNLLDYLFKAPVFHPKAAQNLRHIYFHFQTERKQLLIAYSESNNGTTTWRITN